MTVIKSKNKVSYTMTAVFLNIVGVLAVIAALLLAFIRFDHILDVLPTVIVSLVGGLLLIGFAKIIDLLTVIANQDYEFEKKEDESGNE